jgi:hypothetical protein
VDNDYLNTMGIPLLRGRGFAADDRAGAELVTIISKTLAEKLFPNAEAGQAIGRRLIFGNDEKTTQTLTVVGSAAISRRANELAARAVAVAARATAVSGAVPDCAQHAWRTATENDRDA